MHISDILQDVIFVIFFNWITLCSCNNIGFWTPFIGCNEYSMQLMGYQTALFLIVKKLSLTWQLLYKAYAGLLSFFSKMFLFYCTVSPWCRLAIIGVTDQYLGRRIDRDKYIDSVGNLQPHVSRLNHRSVGLFTSYQSLFPSPPLGHIWDVMFGLETGEC